MIDTTKDILISIAGIVVKGSLSKVGVNITDSVVHTANQLLSYIQYKLPNIARSLKSVEQPIDYTSTYSAIEAVAKNDLEMQKLLQEMRQAIQNDQQFAQAVEHELNNVKSQLSSIIENWNGINIKGGNNTITVDTLNF